MVCTLRRLVAITSLALFSTSLFAQPCATEELHRLMLQQDAEYRESYYDIERRTQEQVRLLEQSNERRAVVTIPLVVHVIHLGERVGEGSNISTEQILEAIRGLNERFRGIIGNGGDLEIEFCLANTDPDGNPTTGINRVDGSAVPDFVEDGITWNGDDGADKNIVRGLSIWDHLRYYNIWVVHNIYGFAAGYANYPTSNQMEGAVIEAEYMDYSTIVLTHELGHALNLRHTFDGDGDNDHCPEDDDCTKDGDRVCDTPPHKKDDCSAVNPCVSSVGLWTDSRFNYMSYCSLRNRFTQGQITRVHAALAVSPREDLLISPACSGTASCDSVLCDDGNACTAETCMNGVCEHNPEIWGKLAPFPGLARNEAVRFTIGDKIYVGLGSSLFSNGLIVDFWEYDAASDTWTQRPDFPGALRHGMVSFTIGNKGYAGMGHFVDSTLAPMNDFWEYNPDSSSWTQLADFPGLPRTGLTGVGIGNKGYVGFGFDPTATFDLYKDDFWEYNPATNTWTQKADIPIDRADAQAFSIGEKGYFAFGRSSAGELQDLWEYNPATDAWTEKEDFPNQQAVQESYVAENKGYVVTTEAIWSYDPLTNTWSDTQLPVDTATFNPEGVAAGVANNLVYLFTGRLSNETWSTCPKCAAAIAPGDIAGSTNVCDTLEHTYSVAAQPDQLYIWQVPAGWRIESGQETASITVIASDSADAGFISVAATNSCRASAPATLAVGCNVGVDERHTAGVQLFPNPNAGTFVLRFEDNTQHEILITDMLGKVVFLPTHVRGTYEISLDGPAPGIYFLRAGELVREFAVGGW